MSISGKTASPHEIPYFLSTDKPPDMAAVTKAMADQAHARLDAIAPKQIVGPTKKQLLIANASGVVTAVTASGDVTNDESGVFTIANGAVTDGKTATANKDGAAATPSMRTLGTGSKQAAAGNDSRLSDERTPSAGSVTAAKIATNAVEEAKVKDGAVTSRKAKLTAGVVGMSGSLTLSGSYQDVPGTTLEITPAVTSMLLIVASFTATGSGIGSTFVGTMRLDSADQSRVAAWGEGGGTDVWIEKTLTQVYSLTLSAGEKHTIKMRAKAGGSNLSLGGSTAFLYELIAS